MTTEQQLRKTDEFLHQQIPITRAMGICVDSYDEDQFILTAPLALNHNHLGTAFGGSLSAVATLAGYGLLWLELGNRKAHIVIRKSTIEFLRPVRHDIRAICLRPDSAAMEAFKAELEQKKKARISLQVTITDAGLVAVEFSGLFVALS